MIEELRGLMLEAELYSAMKKQSSNRTVQPFHAHNEASRIIDMNRSKAYEAL